MMRIQPAPGQVQAFATTYDDADSYISCAPLPAPEDVFETSIGSLGLLWQISSRLLVGIHGYSPSAGWKRPSMPPKPRATVNAGLMLIDDIPISPDWPARPVWDPLGETLIYGDPAIDTDHITNGSVSVSLYDGALAALWIRLPRT